MPTPDYNFKNGKEYIGDTPLITITEKEGIHFLNGKNAREIFENSSINIELEFFRNFFSAIRRAPNLQTAALEIHKTGVGSLNIIRGLAVILDMEFMQARILYDNLCYPTIVEYLESQGKYS